MKHIFSSIVMVGGLLVLAGALPERSANAASFNGLLGASECGWAWERTKMAAGDLNGDGTADIPAFYNFGYEQSARSLFTGSGGWDRERIKLLAGDFNDDGTADIAAFYNYGSATSALFLLTYNGGRFEGTQVWQSGPGGWDWERTKLVAGDFNGDGTADIAAFYNYGNAKSTLSLFTYHGGRFEGTQLWIGNRGGWDWERTELVAGDFNADGKADIAGFYDCRDANSAIFNFSSTAGW